MAEKITERKKRSRVPELIRLLLSIVMVVGIWKETGPYTAAFATLMMLAIEMNAHAFQIMSRGTREHLNRLEAICLRAMFAAARQPERKDPP